MNALVKHLTAAAISASMLMASGGYLARSFNVEPSRATVVATNTPCNWRTCKRGKISSADKSALAMRISAFTGERIR